MKQKITLNYLGLDGNVHHGSVSRARNPNFEDPENGEYYGEEFLENGKRKIRIISMRDFYSRYYVV